MPDTIELPGTGRRTTRLGFGGSGLMGGLSERESLRLLDTAFDAGIRHFDVAPSYGHGMAERCLGKFLGGKTDQLTVTTKYGILPPSQAGVLEMVRNVARPIARRIPAIRKRAAQAAASMKTRADYSPEEARRSLETSLRDLGLDHIDLWLLHEATADDLDASNLLPVLEKMQQQGRIGMFGIGGDRSHLDALLQRHPGYCRVIQSEWSVSDAASDFPGAFRICYRAVSEAKGVLAKFFQRDPQLCRRWSNELDADLAHPEAVAALMLSTALLSNPAGLVVFSSRNPAHILANVRTAHDSVWKARSKRLLEWIQQGNPGQHGS